MKKSCHAFRVIFCSFMIMAMSLSMIAQRSMSLGDLKFVLPSAGMRMAARTFGIRMATTGITSDMFRTIGGVAFIQTAVPSFEIDALELSCDIADNSASVAINDTVYELPLEVWQLQSIVNFADASGNAAVTLYGGKECRIKYHEAFIDNLMGLRLLQVDLMLSGFLNEFEVGLFPALGGEYIFSPGERSMYESGKHKNKKLSNYLRFMKLVQRLYDNEENLKEDLRFVYDSLVARDSTFGSMPYEKFFSVFLDFRTKSYEEFAGAFYLDRVLSELSNYSSQDPNTYIYTDYDQPINFSSTGQNIVFDGAPYYLFANLARDGSDVDIEEEWTSACKQMSDKVFLINPIVYDSAIKCCQWSAFFRYVKANYPDEWRSFKADVQRLRYDAPEVVTPINLHRDEP